MVDGRALVVERFWFMVSMRIQSLNVNAFHEPSGAETSRPRQKELGRVFAGDEDVAPLAAPGSCSLSRS